MEHSFKEGRIYQFKIDYYKTNTWIGNGFHYCVKLEKGENEGTFITTHIYYDSEEKTFKVSKNMKQEIIKFISYNKDCIIFKGPEIKNGSRRGEFDNRIVELKNNEIVSYN